MADGSFGIDRSDSGAIRSYVTTVTPSPLYVIRPPAMASSKAIYYLSFIIIKFQIIWYDGTKVRRILTTIWSYGGVWKISLKSIGPVSVWAKLAIVFTDFWSKRLLWKRSLPLFLLTFFWKIYSLIWVKNHDHGRSTCVAQVAEYKNLGQTDGHCSLLKLGCKLAV